MANVTRVPPFHGTACLRHASSSYLAIRDGRLCLQGEPFPFRIECFEGNRFYLVHRDRREVAEYYGGTLNSAPDSGYTEQHWQLYHLASGAILIEHADSEQFLGRAAGGELTLMPTGSEATLSFFLEDAALTPGLPYLEISGREGSICLRMAPEVLSIVSRAFLAEWATALEGAMHAMAELTGWLPHKKIEVRAYTDCAAWGYVFREKPVIHVNRDAMAEDLAKMQARGGRDLSFGILHEMSHLFDKACWLFDGEALANLKIPYALARLGATAAPAEFPADVTFDHRTLGEGLYRLDGRLTEERGRFFTSFAAKLIEIADEVGWAAVREAFCGFPPMEGVTHEKRLACFLTRLGNAAGRRGDMLLSPQEWEIVRKNLAGYDN